MLLVQLLSMFGLRSPQAAELELLVPAGHRDAYLIELEKLCEDYDDAHCDKICAHIGLERINSLCEVSFTGKEAP